MAEFMNVGEELPATGLFINTELEDVEIPTEKIDVFVENLNQIDSVFDPSIETYGLFDPLNTTDIEEEIDVEVTQSSKRRKSTHAQSNIQIRTTNTPTNNFIIYKDINSENIEHIKILCENTTHRNKNFTSLGKWNHSLSVYYATVKETHVTRRFRRERSVKRNHRMPVIVRKDPIGRFYKIFRANKKDYKILFKNIKNEMFFQILARENNHLCHFVSPRLIEAFYFIDETLSDNEKLTVVLVSEALELTRNVPSLESVLKIDKCLRKKGIYHNDLYKRKKTEDVEEDPFKLEETDPMLLLGEDGNIDMNQIMTEFEVHAGNCVYLHHDKRISRKKLIAITDFGATSNRSQLVSFGGNISKDKVGGKWTLKYKRSINCKRPKGFSQKQYCKRQTKRYKK
jgi:hypothetical protein